MSPLELVPKNENVLLSLFLPTSHIPTGEGAGSFICRLPNKVNSLTQNFEEVTVYVIKRVKTESRTVRRRRLES